MIADRQTKQNIFFYQCSVSCTHCSYHILWIKGYMKRYSRSCSCFALNHIKNQCVFFPLFFWTDEQTPEHDLVTCHRRSRLKYNCSITGGLLSYFPCPGTGDDWAGRPRHLGQVSLIATCDGMWMVR